MSAKLAANTLTFERSLPFVSQLKAIAKTAIQFRSSFGFISLTRFCTIVLEESIRHLDCKLLIRISYLVIHNIPKIILYNAS